jgi:hypothetical protein|tara:strand:+ start:1215 stop:1457 length:243 start_codon:yes stop_codon:yes gene_type:complete
MPKPIFRIFATYKISNKVGVTRRPVEGVIDTFATTDDINEMKKDETIMNRILYLHKKKPDKFKVEIIKVDIEDQYGFTNY